MNALDLLRLDGRMAIIIGGSCRPGRASLGSRNWRGAVLKRLAEDQIALHRSLHGTDDSEHHVSDDEHDYDDGGVLDKDGGREGAVAPRREPVSRSIISLRASS